MALRTTMLKNQACSRFSRLNGFIKVHESTIVSLSFKARPETDEYVPAYSRLTGLTSPTSRFNLHIICRGGLNDYTRAIRTSTVWLEKEEVPNG